ncbi:MAG: phage tail spike protein [Clostridium sp.]|uniref:phage tail spike protein n=1 Tax=Clostridium sp. TaxID=1506 RepID=UPI003F37349C
MIQLYNKDIGKIAGLVDYKDLHIESILESGDKTLSFSYPKKSKFYDEIIEEAYIRTKDNEYVIKEKNLTGAYTTFICKLNVEDIEGQPFDRFESVEQTIESTLNLALVSTGWVVGTCDIKKKRTVRKTNCSAWDIIQEIKKTFRVDLVFNTLSKSIDVYERLGKDKGTYFFDSLNLKSLQVQGNSYDYATRIIPIGKDGLNIKAINGGKEYVENYQYSRKVKTIYWKDDRYTIAENIKLDAEAKLKDISKPYRSYIASVLNLAKMNTKYKGILDYNLGDIITLVSKDNKVKEKQRIIKIIEYPDNRDKDTVELANATLKFEDVQKEFFEAADTVNNITTDNGTVNGETIDSIKVSKIENLEAEILKVTNLNVINADIIHLKATKADIQSLNAIEIKVGQIEATSATITQLNAINSNLQHAIIGKADVTELNAAAGRINVLESKAASIDNILAGNINASNIASGTITAGSGIIANGAIGSAQISSLDVNKLNAGSIDTSKIQLIGPQGRLRIIGNKLQVLDSKDNKLFERIMLGVDDSNNSCLVLRGTDGKTVFLNQDGLTKEGITEGFGKVTDNSLDASKFDKNSIVRQVNGATETIKGTKVQIGDRSLDVELSTQQNTITEHEKELSTQKASILALDDSIKLKVDNQTFKETTSKINSSITIAKDEANKYTNDLGNKLKADSEKYAIDVANAKAQLATEQVKAYADGKISIEEQARIKQAQDNLNSAIGRSNQAKAEAMEAAEKDATNKSNLVKTYADQVAKAKADLAEANAIANADGKITAEEQKRIQQAQENLNTAIARADKSKADSKIYSDSLGQQLKSNAEKYANDVATTKSELAKQQAIASADGKISIEEKARIKQAEDNLNSAISKANEAEQKAKAHADQVAEQKKKEALSSANVYTNAQITITNSNLSKATSEINILKNQISTKVGQTDIDKSISEIKLGGRNYAFNNPEEGKHITGINSSNQCTVIANLNQNNIQGKELIVSFEYVASGDATGSFRLQTGGSFWWTLSDSIRVNDSKSGKVIYKAGKIDIPVGKLCNVVQVRMDGFSGTINISKLKIEEGNKISGDWTPPPEDINQAIIQSATKTDEKISTIETELRETKESFGVSVRDLNSKTSTIETTITNTTNNLTNKINTAKTDAINSALNSTKAEIDSAKSYAEKVAKDNANLAQSNAINTASSDATKKANDAKSQAINSSNSYANTAKQQAIDTANSHANSIAESKKNEAINIATNKITARTIYAKGTGNDFPSNAVVKIGENILTNGHGRGLQILALDPISLNKSFIKDYDTYAGGQPVLDFVAKINELNNGNYIIIVTSQDSSSLNYQSICDALYIIGGYAPKGSINSYREAYALIGKSKLGKSNGIEMYIPKTANDKRIAEVSVNVDEYGVFLGLNNLGIGTDLDNAIIDSTNKVNAAKDEVKKYSNEVAQAKAQLAMEQVKAYADGKVTIEEQARIKQAQDNLNSAIGRANQAKAEAIAAADKASTDKVNLAKVYADDVANKKAELAKQQAIANADGKISEEEKKRIKQATDNLNTAIAKASVAETNARNYAAQIAEQKKNEAKDYTNMQVKTLNSKVTNVESNINILKNQIATKVSQTDIDKTVTDINNEIKLSNEKIKTAESNFTQKTNSIEQKVSNIETTTSSINGKVDSNCQRISTAESKVTPGAIVNSVNSNLSSGGIIRGVSTSLSSEKFIVKDTDNSRVEMYHGCITAFNQNNKKTYYLNDGEIGICAKDNSDPLGMITSVYKKSLNDGVSLTTPSGTIKGVGVFAGDYAQYITLGHDNIWGNDSRYDEYLTFNKAGYAHFGVGVGFENNEIQDLAKINYKQNKITLMNAITVIRGQVNTNTTDGNLWLNYAKGPDTYNAHQDDINVRIGRGWNNGQHGGLICQDLWVHGNKHRIVDCGDLGFIGMEAYETSTPYFGDIGHGITNEDGECYITFDREFTEVCNTSIEYMVIVQDEGEIKDSWAKPCRKKETGFMIKGSPKTKFSFEVKAVQRGLEKNRFKRLAEKRSLKTDFQINNDVQKEQSNNNILKGESILDDIEFNRAMRYKNIMNKNDKDKSLEIINYMEGANLYG